MADPAKFKSVSVSIATYKVLKYLGDGKITDADLTVSKTIESLARKKERNMDTKMERVSKTICKQCKGNGYVRLLLEEGREEHILDCNKCDNQGELYEEQNSL